MVENGVKLRIFVRIFSKSHTFPAAVQLCDISVQEAQKGANSNDKIFDI